MNKDTFYTQDKCDRCKGDLSIRIMSWFNDQTICDECSDEEDEIKSKMRAKGMNPNDYEGCGYVPQVD